MGDASSARLFVNNLTFGQKLAGAGLALLALTVVLSYSSLLIIGQLGTQLNQAATETNAVVDLIGDIKTNFHQLQGETKRVQFAYVIETTKVDAALSMKLGECKGCHTPGAATSQTTADTAGILIENLRKLRGLIHDGTSQQALQEMETGTSAVQQCQREYLAAVAKGDFAEAHEVLTERMEPRLAGLRKATEALEKSQHALVVAASRAASDQFQSARRTVWIVIGLCLFVLTATFQLVRRMVRGLTGIAGKLFEHASDVARAAAGVSSSGASIADNAVSQASAVDSTSNSAEMVSGNARANLESAAEVARLAGQVNHRVDQANQSLDHLTAAMADIDASSHQISRILRVIDEIASQTNILALNAAVEAARSGEAGLGFAVVADEVRGLAQRCAEAARDSEDLIQASFTRSKAGRDRVAEVTEFVRSVTTDIANVNKLASQLRERSQDEACSIESISRSIQDIRTNTHEFAAAAEESSSAAQTLRQQAQDMSVVVDSMTAMVGGKR